MNIIRTCIAAMGALAFTAFAGHAHEPVWPKGPVTIILPYGTGGGTDSTARALAKSLSDQLKVPVTVENHTGASGSLAAMHFLKTAKPDGQMLFVTQTGVVATVPQLNNVTYKYSDFKYLARLANPVEVLVASQDFPPNNPKEFVEYSKKNPDALAMVFGGVGSQGWMGVQQLQGVLGYEIPAVPVPSGSGADQSAMVAGNHAQAGVISATGVMPFIQSGKVKAIGLMQGERVSILPDVPTFKEQGVDVLIGDEIMLLGRTDTPDNVVAAIDAAVKKAFADEGFTTTIANLRLVANYGDSKQMTEIIGARAKMAEELLQKAKK
jgi:tripartite-type tricarboxylate transporter receptor subunit TctC